MSIRTELINRIVFAKYLHKEGVTACNTSIDQVRFTKGILLLHDSVELVFGAIADKLNVNLGGNIFLMQYYDRIKAKDPEQRDMPYYTQMNTLNNIRNGIKHHGVLPDIQSNKHYPSTVEELLIEVCKTYLDIEYQTISLLYLINNEEVQYNIKEAQEHNEKGQYEESLISSAKAMYKLCESSSVLTKLYLFESSIPENNEIVFPEIWDTGFKVSLIEHGVNPHDYYKFKLIAPEIGQNRTTKELVPWWNDNYGHSMNWTRENTDFCICFAIDAALKFQRESTASGLSYYGDHYIDKVTCEVENCEISNISKYASPRYPFGEIVERKTIKVLVKGEHIIGYANRSKEHQDEIFIYSQDLESEINGHSIVYGWVNYDEVSVSREEVSHGIEDFEIIERIEGT